MTAKQARLAMTLSGMRKAFVLIVLLPMVGWTTPYFRFNNPLDKPVMVTGALLATDLKDTEATVLYPPFTHKTEDGCLLPNIVCEDWTPLAIGAGMMGGKVSVVLGPVVNVLPWMSAAALGLIPESWTSVRGVVTPAKANDVTFSAGPMWEYQQITNKGYYRTFAGLALHF